MLWLRRLRNGRPPGSVSLVRGGDAIGSSVDSTVGLAIGLAIGGAVGIFTPCTFEIVVTLVFLFLFGSPLVDQILAEFCASLVDADTMTNYL